jgi:hypothetical protein
MTTSGATALSCATARALVDVPDINADPDHTRPLLYQLLHHVGGPCAENELDERGVFAQLAHVGSEVAQPQRGVNVAGVDRDKNDAGHRSILRDARKRHGRRALPPTVAPMAAHAACCIFARTPDPARKTRFDTLAA